MELEQKLTQQMQQAAQKARLECGVNTSQLEKELQTKGAAAMMKQLCKRGMVSEVFDALNEKKRLELSPEAIASKGEFAMLFTDAEADWFFQVLCQEGYF